MSDMYNNNNIIIIFFSIYRSKHVNIPIIQFSKTQRFEFGQNFKATCSLLRVLHVQTC